MNKKEAEDYIYKSYLKAERYQNYNDADANKRRPDLSRKAIEELSRTECVVVTGSKGKGSVSSMISRILQTKLKVGLLTSPHLVDFCERFKINGHDISDSDFIKHVEIVRSTFDKIDNDLPVGVCISPIALQVAVALSYFNEKKTDFNVLECGKGAKYDDVNNVIHQYSVINSIFLEHTRELGDTLEKIAEDKAHVISQGQKCAYIAKQEDSVLEVLRERAKSMGVLTKTYGIDFEAINVRYTNHGMLFDIIADNEVFKDVSIPLLGDHQARNCALAFALCKDVLGEMDINQVKNNLLSLNWPGRMEILNSNPFVMLDACINRESCQSLKQALDYLNMGKSTIIIGIPDDKDYLGVAEAMKDYAETIILTKSHNQHYVFSEKQTTVLKDHGIAAIRIPNVEEAIRFAQKNPYPIVILGTTSVVSEVKVLQQA